jgi:hypothetical protein
MKRKRGRPRTAHLRRMHLASCIDDWAAESNHKRGSVKAAMHELYDMEHGDGEPPRDVQAFLRTIKKDLRLGRRELREWQEFLRRSWAGWRRNHPDF